MLKGAALYAVWQSESALVSYRPTRDLDFWSLGTPDVAALVAALREVVMLPVEDDGIRFDAATIQGEVRRADEKYVGCNLEMVADVGGIEIRVLIDFGFGDAITPAARRASYPTILKSFAAPQLQNLPARNRRGRKVRGDGRVGIGEHAPQRFLRHLDMEPELRLRRSNFKRSPAPHLRAPPDRFALGNAHRG